MQIDFDFFDHQLRIATSEGRVRTIALQPRSVADFYRAVMNALADLGLAVTINTKPYDAVRQADDPDQALLSFLHSTCDAAAKRASWDTAALRQTWFK